MSPRLRRGVLALSGLVAAPAQAEPTCVVETYVWDLKLVEVAAEEGTLEPKSVDLPRVAARLGSLAELRGGAREEGASGPRRATLVGSTDGEGLLVRLESAP